MKILKLNGKLTLPLILIVLSIWGVVIYNVICYFNSFDKEDSGVAALNAGMSADVKTGKRTAANIDTLTYNNPISKSPFTLGVKIEAEKPAPKPVAVKVKKLCASAAA